MVVTSDHSGAFQLAIFLNNQCFHMVTKGPQDAFKKVVGGNMKKELLKLAKTVIAPLALAVAMAFSPVAAYAAGHEGGHGFGGRGGYGGGHSSAARETTAAADITADTEAACAAAIMPDAVITVAVATMVGVVIMAWVSGSAFMRLTAMLLRHATLRGFMTHMAAGKPIRAAQFPTDINALAASIGVLVTRGKPSTANEKRRRL
jgi:hypothetical protein